jgi:dihydrofolate synthase / folylpolyglutamate synthase
MTARYRDALEKLLASPTRPKLGLLRMRALLHQLADPQQRLRVLHVAGTKGKGSVCVLAAEMCRAHGLKVGLTMSPHLCSARERIVIDGVMVDEERFASLAERVERAAHALTEDTPSFFEKMIAMALCAFADARVEVAVVEVGLGGRLDATNVLAPRACAITRLGLDHTEWLGPTLAHIAREKAGIMKRDVPVFTVAQDREAARVLQEVAENVGAPLTVVREQDAPATQLLGAHQRENASLAAALARAGAGVSDAAVSKGAWRASLEGRYETARTAPLVILDGAHNALSARALGDALRADTRLVGRPLTLVIGMTSGHDARSFFEALGPLPKTRVLAVRARSPRAQDAEAVAAACGGTPVSSLARAIEQGSDGPVVVTGSLYLVGEARSLLLGVPSDPAFPLF